MSSSLPLFCRKFHTSLKKEISFLKMGTFHNLEIPWFSYLSDFTWNQFWRVYLEGLKLPFFEALQFVNLVNFSPLKIPKNPNSEPINLLKWQIRIPKKLISRKIWVTENSWDFHTLHLQFRKKRSKLCFFAKILSFFLFFSTGRWSV